MTDKVKKRDAITTYKGFDKDWKCRDMQYEVGQVYKYDGKVRACKSGYHACENPFDVFNYYSPANSKFALTKSWSNISREGSDSKIASGKISLELELSLPEFIDHGVKYIMSKITDSKRETNTGYRSASTNTGYQSVSTNTGNQSVSTNTGNQSVSTNTGNQSVSTNTGNQSASTNTGNQSVSTNTGNQSVSTNTGDCSVSTNTGYQSVSTNTGDCSVSTNTGYRSVSTNTGDCSASIVKSKQSISISTGYKSKSMASKDSAIVIVERNDEMEIINIFSSMVGQNNIKPDTFYMLIDGIPTECE